jgi:hypothetical protein
VQPKEPREVKQQRLYLPWLHIKTKQKVLFAKAFLVPSRAVKSFKIFAIS